MPPWLAWMVQVPSMSRVACAPLTVQTEVVVDVYVNARPELAVPPRVMGEAVISTGPGVKLMVCEACATPTGC